MAPCHTRCCPPPWHMQMDRKAQDKAFMDVAGIGSDHSAGLRDARPEE